MFSRWKSWQLAAAALVLAIAAIWLFRAIWQPAEKPADQYTVGAVLALTGRGATFGQRALNGMQLAVDELNAEHVSQNRSFKLIVEDSQSSAQRALTAFRKLVDVDRVSVAVGFVLSDEVLACAPIANERLVILLTTAAGSDQIKTAGDFVFRVRESAAFQSQRVATAAVAEFGISRLAVLHSNSANGISYSQGFVAAARSQGATVEPAVGYNEGKTDYRSEIQQLRAAGSPGVYLAGLDQEIGLILKQSAELGFKPQFFASPGAISPKLLEIAGPAAEGLVSASAAFDTEAKDPAINSFTKQYRARFGTPPDFIAANSYDAVKLIASLFMGGARSGGELKDRLYQVKDFSGVGGTITFDSDGEVQKPIGLVQVVNGNFAPLRR